MADTRMDTGSGDDGVQGAEVATVSADYIEHHCPICGARYYGDSEAVCPVEHWEVTE